MAFGRFATGAISASVRNFTASCLVICQAAACREAFPETCNLVVGVLGTRQRREGFHDLGVRASGIRGAARPASTAETRSKGGKWRLIVYECAWPGKAIRL